MYLDVVLYQFFFYLGGGGGEAIAESLWLCILNSKPESYAWMRTKDHVLENWYLIKAMQAHWGTSKQPHKQTRRQEMGHIIVWSVDKLVSCPKLLTLGWKLYPSGPELVKRNRTGHSLALQSHRITEVQENAMSCRRYSPLEQWCKKTSHPS